jgi:beta-mannosidase
MDTRARGSVVGVDTTVWLHDGWTLARSREADAAEWCEAVVPGTVAASLKHDIGAARDFDAEAWWYRKAFARPSGQKAFLRFDGLATLATVWLNGTEIVSSRNMFLAHRVDVTPLLRAENELVIRFAALEDGLKERRARPRWKTALVSQQNLRWFRTTLLGRMPAWSPAVAPVGPWGPIALECVDRVDVSRIEVQAHAEGDDGRLRIRARVEALDDHVVQAARVRVGDGVYPLELAHGAVHGDLTIPGAPRWWPHTHGAPTLLACQLELRVDGTWRGFHCDPVGFKSVTVDPTGGKVRFHVNGVPVFCRGACWTPADFLRLRADPVELRRTLETARDAGLNMLRIGGTMTYESDEFYRLCDELGILVWQDFMFANMDYPFGDAGFLAQAEAEVRYQLGRFQRHACIAAYCGGSEVAQQAAMMGLPASEWCHAFFTAILPRHCGERHPGIPYFPSTPWGGALPFHVGTGLAHYYGVGAYRRPLADVKNARVKFATECLGFSNVPEPDAMMQAFGSATPAPHHPRWKARVPRDHGAGYDFEDVRDHYLRELFRLDPVALRSRDLERYYAVSRVVSGEVMSRLFSEWRSPSSECGGALVWFFRDLWAGAGWGITDSGGRPKAAYWYLKRAWQPQAIHLTDEGLDGLAIHVVNDTAEFLDATVELEMLHGGRVALCAPRKTVLVPARGTLTFSGDALIGHFTDSTDAYRFGPPKHDVVAARLIRNDTGEVLGEDFHFPAGMDLCRQRGAMVDVRTQWRADGSMALTLKSDTFLQATHIACDGFSSSDNYFHLSPSGERTISFYPRDGAAPTMFKAHIEALNLADTISVRAQRLPEPEQR